MRAGKIPVITAVSEALTTARVATPEDSTFVLMYVSTFSTTIRVKYSDGTTKGVAVA